MIQTIDMRGFSSDTVPVNPDVLSPKQRAVYESLSYPKTLQGLYKFHKDLLPESSVRRILYVLQNKGLSERTFGKDKEGYKVVKWRKVK